MRFPIRRDLGLQLLALYLLFVAPVILASILFDRVASRRLENDVKASDLAIARAIAQETDTNIKNALLAVQELAGYPAVINADQAGMETLFKNLMTARPDVNLVYRLDTDGMMVFHYPTGPGSTVGEDFSFRDYFKRAKTSDQPLLSLGRISPTTQQPVTTAVMPIRDSNGQFLGLTATNIKLQSLSDSLSSIANSFSPNEAFNLLIIDAAGRVIAHPDPDQLLSELSTTLPSVTGEVLDGSSGNILISNPASGEMLYSYSPIPSAGWGVIVSRPTATAFATLRSTHRGVMITISVFLIVGLFFWLALSRQVLRPLERLAAFSQTIGLDEEVSDTQNKDLKLLSKRPDQIGNLIRSLTRMEEAINARLNELSTLLETSAAVISTLDSSTVLNRILEQVERLMGITKCAVVALDEKHGVFRAQASRGLSRRYSQQIAISPSEPQSVTMRAIRSGEPIQVSDTEQDVTFAPMRPRARSEGYRSILAVPLRLQHAPPAALLVYRPDPHVFSEREINLLSSFANHAAMAIENAALYARSDMRLREQTRRLEALIQSFQDGLILEDLHGVVHYANRRIAEIVNLSLSDVIGAPVESITERLLGMTVDGDLNQRENTRRAVQDALDGVGPRRVELEIASPTQTRYLRLHVFDVTDSDGKHIGRGQILRDITQNWEIDRMKSSLISIVSHELRTPLASIKGYASTLLAEDVEWDVLTQHEFLEIISSETDRLTKLVNDLLDMSRIESGNVDVSRIDCSLVELVERAAKRADPPPGMRLEVQIAQELPMISVDPQRIEAVLRNLIENATRYSGDHSPIVVSARVQAAEMIVSVKDEGPGIPVEYSHRVFESFYRLGDELTSTSQGAGLGLAICKGFVHAHGGQIWIEPQNKGTCISFSLPLQPIEATPRA